MSYDLVFWRQTAAEETSPQEIYEAIAAGGAPPAELVALSIESLLARCLEEFPSAERQPNGDREWIVWDGPGQRWSFQIE